VFDDLDTQTIAYTTTWTTYEGTRTSRSAFAALHLISLIPVTPHRWSCRRFKMGWIFVPLLQRRSNFGRATLLGKHYIHWILNRALRWPQPESKEIFVCL